METEHFAAALAVLLLAAGLAPARAQDMAGSGMLGKGLFLPRMDAAAGRALFASKGCVVCHAVNGIGGEDAPALDAKLMEIPMNPFDFAASMWRGSEAMVALQRDELGEVVDLSGEELADIIAFVHDPDEQAKFSMADVPANISMLMMRMGGDE